MSVKLDNTFTGPKTFNVLFVLYTWKPEFVDEPAMFPLTQVELVNGNVSTIKGVLFELLASFSKAVLGVAN